MHRLIIFYVRENRLKKKQGSVLESLAPVTKFKACYKWVDIFNTQLSRTAIELLECATLEILA